MAMQKTWSFVFFPFFQNKRIIFSFILIFISCGSFAKISKKHRIENILYQSNRMDILRKKPKLSFQILEKVFYSTKYNDDLRWRALMSMARLNPKKAKFHVLKALKNKNWFFKNAGLIAMEIINPNEAVFYSHLFLSDPSLILRTASVEIIRKYKAVQYKNLLWRKIKSKENFRKGKSLWIRKYIAQTLYEFSDEKDIYKFANLLNDPDPQIRQLAVQTLDKFSENQYARFIDFKKLKKIKKQIW